MNCIGYDNNCICFNCVDLDTTKTHKGSNLLAECLIEAQAELDAVAKAMNAYPDSDLVSLAKTLLARDKYCTELEERIAKALKYSGGRWSEWGDRAMGVLEILAPEEMPDD